MLDNIAELVDCDEWPQRRLLPVPERIGNGE